MVVLGDRTSLNKLLIASGFSACVLDSKMANSAQEHRIPGIVLYLGDIEGETLSFSTPQNEEGWKATPGKWVVVTENSEQGYLLLIPTTLNTTRDQSRWLGTHFI